MGIASLHTLLNYNLDVSAKTSRKVLGVVYRKDARGSKTKVLQEIDLKTATLFTKIILWWHGSLQRNNLNNFLKANLSQWDRELSQDNGRHLLLEKQCAKLRRKIKSDNPFQWTLHVNIERPDWSLKTTVLFDRLTTNESIYNWLLKQKGKVSFFGYQFSTRLSTVFDQFHITGQYQGSQKGLFLQDEEKGQDRTCTLTFSNKNMDRCAQVFHDKTWNEGYNSGYSSGHSAGYSEGKNDGYQEGYSSGRRSGYDDGFDDGKKQSCPPHRRN